MARRVYLTTARWLCGLIAPVAAGCAGTGDQIPAGAVPTMQNLQADNWNARRVHYDCDSGRSLAVQYLNIDAGPAFAVLHYGGTVHLLQRRRAASGARYIAVDEQYSLRWQSKGRSGSLYFLAADHTASEQLLAECTAPE